MQAGSHTAAVMGLIVGGNCGPLSGALVRWQIKQRMLLFWRSSALGLITRCTPTLGTLFIDVTHALKCTVTAVGGIVLSHSKKAVEREEKKWFLSLHLAMNSTKFQIFFSSSLYLVIQTFILFLATVPL